MPKLAVNGIHIAVLWGFALAQPVFSDLDAAFFLMYGSLPRDIVAFALLAAFAGPALLLALEVVVARVAPAALDAVHLAIIAVLAAVLAAQIVARNTDLPTPAHLLLAGAAGVAAAAVYRRAPPVRTFLSVLAPAPIVFVAVFLLFSPVSKIVLSKGQEPTAAHVGKGAPVVLIALDELPASSLMDARGRIDRDLYPNLARLAADATWFRHATTVHASTTHAQPAIDTGRLPPIDGLPYAADHPHSIFTLLGGSYAINASEPYSDVCPRRLCPETPPDGFRTRLRGLVRNSGILALRGFLPESVGLKLPELADARDVDEADQVNRFAAAIRPTPRASLNYIHLLLPHNPFQYTAGGRHYDHYYLGRAEFADAVAEIYRRRPFLVAQRYQRHLVQMMFTDRLVGRILARLRSTGLYDRALVVVVSDHGVSFRPGGHVRQPTTANAEDILSVPLLMKLPGERRGRVSDFHARTIDVLPTIADALGIRLPWRVQGHSLLRRRPDPRRVQVEKDSGATVALSASTFDRRLTAAVRRRLRLFGGRPFVFGPRPDLLGRRVRPGRLPRLPQANVALHDPNALRSVDPSSTFLPARLGGTIRGSALRAGAPLAVGLNGRIWATTRAFADDDHLAFTVLLPEHAFRRGANRFSLLAVRPQGLALVG